METLTTETIREIIEMHGLAHAERVIEEHMSQHGSESVKEAKAEWNHQAKDAFSK